MLKFHTTCVALLALASLSSAGCRERDKAAKPPGMTLTKCVVPGWGHPAECGTLRVPLKRDAPNEGQVDLRVVRIPAAGEAPSPTPLFMLAGGPGQAATEAYTPFLAMLGDFVRDREIVLVDIRGTGQSAPLDCAVEEDMKKAFAPGAFVRTAKECAAKLRAEGRLDAAGTLSAYRTAAAADDLDAVREALGYARIDLLGGSYGTRLALAYAERHPQRARSLVLDGMAPRGLIIPLPMAKDAERAIDKLTKRCRDVPECTKAFPDVAGDLKAVAQRLEDDPQVTIHHPRTGEELTVELRPSAFKQALRGLLYAPELAVLLPLAAAEAKRGNFEPFVGQAFQLEDGNMDAMSLGLFLSIVCAEDIPRITDEAIAKQTEGTFLGRVMIDEFRQACAVWPAGPPESGVDQPVKVTMPILALSGELDPVTPPHWADHVLEHSAGREAHVIIPGSGHGTLIRTCVPELIDGFLDAPDDVESLDTSCVTDVFPSFFVDFAGPPH